MPSAASRGRETIAEMLRTLAAGLLFGRVATADPAPAPTFAPDAGYVAVAGGLGFGTRSQSSTAAGVDAGYRPGADPLLVHAAVIVGEFQPFAGGGADPPPGPSGSYFAIRGGIETDACTRPWSCLIFGADLGYVQEHASGASEVDPDVIDRALVAVGRLGLELRGDTVRLAFTGEGQVGYGRGFTSTTSPNGIGLVVSLGGRL